jgi:amphi-Trp domain-containing protein
VLTCQPISHDPCKSSQTDEDVVTRDIEKQYSRTVFIAKLRRLADALERGERFVTQVAGRRVVVPDGAVAGVEYEREGGHEELELQLRWTRPPRRSRKRG